MNLFFTPNATFSVSLVWSAKHSTFLRIPPQEGGVVFELATPTQRQAHEQYHGLMGVPGHMGFIRTEEVVWGVKDDTGKEVTPGLVRSVQGMPAGSKATPPLTLALARIVREEIGLSQPLVDTPSSKDAEGNSDSPSGSGSDSSPSPAGSAATQTVARD